MRAGEADGPCIAAEDNRHGRAPRGRATLRVDACPPSPPSRPSCQCWPRSPSRPTRSPSSWAPSRSTGTASATRSASPSRTSSSPARRARRGLDARLVDNGIIIVAVAALIGGRLYHVIDQWQLYQDDLLKIVLPPYTGLGVYGGILTGTIAAVVVHRQAGSSRSGSGPTSSRPACSSCRRSGGWGNFFNQELYGPPTTLPWGIAIDCEHRIATYPCADVPVDTTFFQPLFLYESLSGFIGAITLLWIARRWGARLRPGDLFLLFLVWYAVVRLLLETLRDRQLDVLRDPDRDDRVGHRDRVRDRRVRDPAPAGVGRRAWGDPPRRTRTTTYEADDEETVEVDDDEDEDATMREDRRAATSRRR